MLIKSISFLFLLIIPMKIWSEIANEILRPNFIDFPRKKGTVGAILYTIFGDNIFVLLAQEALNSGHEKAGTFSDFGGSTVMNQTFAENLSRELNEESCGLILINSEEIISNAHLFYINKKSEKNPAIPGRDIFYAMILCSKYVCPEEFVKKRKALILKKGGGKQEMLEKDRIEWVNIKDILHYTDFSPEGFIVRNIKGESIRIMIRRFFWNDFLNHPDLKNKINLLSKKMMNTPRNTIT